jgi:hypothetical protein
MARRWTPSSWNRARSIKTSTVEKARLGNGLITLVAFEEMIGNEKQYWVQIYGTGIGGYRIHTYNNKDEANAKWCELKNRYF